MLQLIIWLLISRKTGKKPQKKYLLNKRNIYISSGFSRITIIYKEMNLAKVYYSKLITFGVAYFKMLLHVKFHNVLKKKNKNWINLEKCNTNYFYLFCYSWLFLILWNKLSIFLSCQVISVSNFHCRLLAENIQ